METIVGSRPLIEIVPGNRRALDMKEDSNGRDSPLIETGGSVASPVAAAAASAILNQDRTGEGLLRRRSLKRQPPAVTIPDKSTAESATSATLPDDTPPSPAASQSLTILGWIHLGLFVSLVAVAAIGCTFYDTKWTRLSPRVYSQALGRFKFDDLGPPEPVTKFTVDLLNNPVTGLAEVALGMDGTPPNEDFPPWSLGRFIGEPFLPTRISVFVPAVEKHEYLVRNRLLHSLDDSDLDFSKTLVCTDLNWSQLLPEAMQHLTNSTTQREIGYEEPPLPVVKHAVVEETDTNNDSSTSDDASACIPSSLNEMPSVHLVKGPGRSCALWTNPKSKWRSLFAVESSSEDTSRLSRLIVRTQGLIAPNYPLRSAVEFLMRNPLAYGGAILIAWSHSLALPQPVSVLHAPRLGIYAGICLWRAFGLFYGLGIVEKIPWIESKLVETDQSLHRQVFGLNREGGYEGNPGYFDFSDHIVLAGTLIFILSCEAFCLIRFRRNFPGKHSVAKSTLNTPTSSTTATDSNIDNPLEVPTAAVYVFLFGIGFLIQCLTYASMLTAAFFHTPLEILVGLGVLLAGIVIPFWSVLILDIGLLRHYFGVDR